MSTGATSARTRCLAGSPLVGLDGLTNNFRIPCDAVHNAFSHGSPPEIISHTAPLGSRERLTQTELRGGNHSWGMPRQYQTSARFCDDFDCQKGTHSSTRPLAMDSGQVQVTLAGVIVCQGGMGKFVIGG